MIAAPLSTHLAPINVQLAEYSELFMLISAFIYTLAFILFTVDTVRSSATIRRVEAELSAEQQRERAQRLVGASAPNDAVAPNDAAPPRASDEDLVDDDLAYVGTTRPFANVAVALTAVAAAAHGFAVVARGLAASRWPTANMFEFLTAAALVVSVVYLAGLIRRDLRFLGVFVLGLVVTMMAGATIGFPTPIGHVQPALQSPWIAIHVTLAVLAMAVFTLTFAMNLLQLLQSRRERVLDGAPKGRFERGLATNQFMRLVPSAFSLESWAYRLNAVGFVFWTLGPMITGAIWANESWGRYWGWDPKEVWTFVIWVVYAGYLHARATRGWTGNRAAWLSIIGFICIIINYTVVNMWFPGLHSYAGLPE
ncbi:c-type cytochrome biogenesis protein CcsB [Nesterenkonia sphaerica]|uniref:C-type cytochrome biogenesis protein CcsB n=1 Tax=Nesterenkonia sphaerica TaxID=1804988 RepID=A0A5R9A257_9MICC|nr:c-type cytochrome biogenesis protein CcsB [Nesterenkonia sphaerica]TLP72769.1 c-type cytochrome biogenesis protein CcsB [Nesterenkonia sphaerica]